ncbi:class I SAM-dependent methyltransferase [Streptomyces carpaticus]|uniref:class I SAM-dependent methyltransferase n=1 Tax=Streptomyces TaxID=1883 RepID=UPI001FF92219|nr:class I SAM-dependent methyltransferase [Streptomyces sp. XM4011]MCK1815449.1 class I SAM-dependent methyltransferase [Streptomyces sp. XM4011]UWM52296.1 class I SAM-dependent methyltransferase [Streptomyces carpaticus]
MGRHHDDFETLVEEARRAPVDGWDFSWLEGRATEERPPWGYARLLGRRLATVHSALDLDTGGGEVLDEAPVLPPLMAVTESWPPNAALAAARLGPRGVVVTVPGDDGRLPFPDGVFDLVSARHPVRTDWPQIARVLRPGGAFLAQEVGPRSVAELGEYFLGPWPQPDPREPEAARAAAEAAGLRVVDLRTATLRTVFHDIGAVVWFLRKVVWIVPGFTVERHLPALRRLHQQIREQGPFTAHTTRFLIEARKPGP